MQLVAWSTARPRVPRVLLLLALTAQAHAATVACPPPAIVSVAAQSAGEQDPLDGAALSLGPDAAADAGNAPGPTCLRFDGVRFFGAGFNGGAADALRPGFGARRANATDCQEWCRSDARCQQWVFHKPSGSCFRLLNAFAGSAADPKFASGACGSQDDWPAACGEPPTPPSHASWASNCSTLGPGATCHGACRAGFRGAPSVACGPAGTWLALNGSCAAAACSPMLGGFRAFGAGFNAGGAADALRPGFGARRANATDCQEWCRSDARCQQWVFHKPSGGCFRLLNAFAGSAADPKFASGACSSQACGEPPTPPSHASWASNCSTLGPGATCHGACQAGFRGALSVTCGPAGTWLALNGSCAVAACTAVRDNQRFFGAGFNGGAADALRPGFGARRANTTDCQEWCRSDARCQQWVFHKPSGGCFRLLNAFAGSAADPKFASGACSA